MSSSEENEGADGTHYEHREISDDETTGDTGRIASNRRRRFESKRVKQLTNEEDGVARRVFIAHIGISQVQWKNVKTVLLPHPKTQEDALFVFDVSSTGDAITERRRTSNFVFEVLAMTEEEGLSSWFIGNNVSSNGNLYVFTPVDPLYFIIPAMSKSLYARPLMDHLIEYYPSTFSEGIHKGITTDQLLNISIKKVNGDIEAYIFDELKTLDWLGKKVKAVAQFLSEAKLSRSESSVSVNFVRGSQVASEEGNDQYIQYGCDLVSEYLNNALKEKLQNSLGIPTDCERAKRKNDDDEGRSKRFKMEKILDGVTPLEDYGSVLTGKTIPKGPTTARQKQLLQAAKGSHSLLKFFKPKVT